MTSKMSQNKAVNVLNFFHRGTFGTQPVTLLATNAFPRRHALGVTEMMLRGETLFPRVPLRGSQGTGSMTPKWQSSKTAQCESLPQWPFLGLVGSLLKLLPSLPNDQLHLWNPLSVRTFILQLVINQKREVAVVSHQ